MTLYWLLLTIGALMLFEGIYLTIKQKETQKLLRQLAKNPRLIRQIGMIEIIIAIFILLITNLA